jgi:hypothetical protein
VTGRWTGRGLCLTGRVWSVLRVCARLGLLTGRSGASGHSRPDTSGRSGSLLDSNWTLALWRPVNSAARPVADLLVRCSGLTSVSGPLRDQRVWSSFARPVIAWNASGRWFASVALCDRRVRSIRPARPVSATAAVSSF